MPAAPIMGLTLFLTNRFMIFANSTPPTVSNTNAMRPSPKISSVSTRKNSAAVICAVIVMPRIRVIKLDSTFCAASERLFNTPHSRSRLPNIKKPMSAAERLDTMPATAVMRTGNRILVVFETEPGVYAMRMRRSFLVVSRRMTGGCTMGTSAIYEYAATVMAPIYCEFKMFATKMEVGPSAAPMIAMEAASCRSKLNSRAMLSVKNMPNCAAAPNKNSFGLESSGSKSIIAPMPMKRSSGKSSFAMPLSNNNVSTPTSSPCVTAPESGRLTRIVPKPMGKSSAGSIFFAMAR